MYKLVGVAGKIRGQEFEVQDGDNVVGRGDDATIKLEIKEVSKRHFSLSPSGDGLWLEDLGSANGTFVNGKLEKKCLLKAGDKISIPDAILEVVEVQERKKIIKKYTTTNVEVEDEVPDYIKRPPVPETFLGKLIWFFKYKIMPFVHSMNEDYEWRSLIGILLAVFVLVVMTMTISPILIDARNVLIEETTFRAQQYTSMIDRIYGQSLLDHNVNKIDIGYLKREPGIMEYELFDLDGRIISPTERQNQYVNDPFSVRAREWAAKQDNKGEHTFREVLMSGDIGVAQKIMAYDPKVGSFVGVGVIAIHFMPESLVTQASKNSLAYLNALAVSIVIAVIFFGIFYYVTLRPLQEIRYQIDEALRGKRKNLEPQYLMAELDPLRNNINTLLQRLRELQNQTDDASFDEVESDLPYLQNLEQFMEGAGVPVIILDSQKKVKRINAQAEDLCGIREASSIDQDFLEVAREKGLGATVTELCDLSAGNGGAAQSGEYELSGNNYHIYAKAMIGHDSFAKAFYLTFLS